MNNKPLNILIVDDSAVYRKLISLALKDLPEVQEIRTASNGLIALNRIKITDYDLILLDIDMPIMDGFETFQNLKQIDYPAKVLFFSSVSYKFAKSAINALSLGLFDFVAKPSSTNNESDPVSPIRQALLPKIQQIYNRTQIDNSLNNIQLFQFPKINLASFKAEIIVIGSSTGGPLALEKIISSLEHPLRCPIVIAQHMPPVFTNAFARHLSQVTGHDCTEAKDNEVVENKIYIAPGNYHTRILKNGDQLILSLSQDEPINFVRPSVDPLFESAARIFTNHCLGIVLTGMGKDGSLGSLCVKKHDGAIIIQDQQSSVVYGMPGAVYKSGAFDLICSLNEISHFINSSTLGYQVQRFKKLKA